MHSYINNNYYYTYVVHLNYQWYSVVPYRLTRSSVVMSVDWVTGRRGHSQVSPAAWIFVPIATMTGIT